MSQLNQHRRESLHDIHVVLNYGPLGLVQAATEHISQDQMQVNTGAIILNHHAEVEIVISIPGLEHSEHHRIAAQVIHCGENGNATLGFRCCGEKTMQALLPYVTFH